MRSFLIAGACALAGLAHAGPTDQRALFRDALAAAKRGDLTDPSRQLARLEGYPLYAYVIAADLGYRLRTDTNRQLDTRIQRFISEHPGLPAAHRLRRRWLANLAERQRWQQVLEHTPEDHGTTAECRVVHARFETGGAPRAAALALWRAGHSQPDACDPVFAWLKNNGALTPDEILDRARLAVLDNHYGLARYLARKLPDALSSRVDSWLAITQTPSNLSFSHDIDGDIAVHAFKRYALRDLEAAADLLAQLTERMSFSAGQRYAMKRYIALLYAQDQQSEALVWFARLDHERMGEHALGWEIRAALYHHRWPLVIDAIRNLPRDLADTEEWRYWLARALAETGQPEKARAIYAALSRERSYYGYLAADAIGREYSLNERPLAANPDAAARVRAKPALARARELRALGMVYKANREWRQVTDGLNPAALGQAARIAYQWQWYSRAIITLAKADYWDDLDIRYPIVYSNIVKRAAQANGLDPAYILGIIRTESLFQPDVRSSAGAVGLMQLLPGTARHVARRMGDGAPSPNALGVPAVNIQLGSYYLASMLERWHGNIALASASYNAGPHRIADWLPEHTMDPTIWIANIPYTQTRHYVTRAMSHMTVFQDRLGEDIVSLKQRIAPIQPGYPDDDR